MASPFRSAMKRFSNRTGRDDDKEDCVGELSIIINVLRIITSI
jgi:hypothetical protein